LKPADTSAPFIDFGEDEDEEQDLEEIKRKQDEEFDFSGMLRQTAAESQKKPTAKGCCLNLIYLFLLYCIVFEH